jgi:tRNA A-37 threonylcarbamoyl transferase component Bud32
MMEEAFNKISAGGLSWFVREGYRDLIDLNFVDGGVLSNVDENTVRIRGFFDFRDERIFVKVFKKRSGAVPLAIFKRVLFGHSAKKEFDASRYLNKKGIDTPDVLAVGVGPVLRSDAVIIFKVIENAPMLVDVLSGFDDDATGVEKGRYTELIRLVAQITAKLHVASFHHRDYHAGNLLVEGVAGGKPKLFVIDLHRSSFPRRMKGKRALKNIAAISHSLSFSSNDENIQKLLGEYVGAIGNDSLEIDDSEKALGVIKRRIWKMEKRRLKSRTKRCFKNSTEFFVKKQWGETIFGRRGIDIAKIVGLIEEFDGGGGRVLKNDKKAKIVMLPWGEEEICIKGYELSSIKERVWAMFRKSRGHVSWWSARGLAVRGFNTPLPLALVIAKKLFIPSKIYFVTESLKPARELDRFILNVFKDNNNGKENFLTGLAKTISTLHKMGIYHGDLKRTNIGVFEEGGDYAFSLIDLDDVSFTDGVTSRRRAKNLSQLYLSTPSIIGAEDRVMFFREYLKISGGSAEGEKIKRGVMEIVRGEEFLFVSDTGDVIEDGGELFVEIFGRDK